MIAETGFSAFLHEYIAPWLERVLDPLDSFFLSLPPWMWTACAVALFVVPCVGAFLLRREFIYDGAPDRAPWRDLRVWGGLISIPYVVLYLIF